MMKQNAHAWGRKAAVLGCLLALALASSPVAGAERVRGQYATSKSPIYRVGTLDPKLSRLCRDGKFKQRKLLLLSIGYVGPKGKGISGIAQKNWNLYDPTGAAKDNMTYHFFNQGYSNCRVYVAKNPPPPPPRP